MGERYNLCMRVQGGRQHQLAGGEIGWLYPIDALHPGHACAPHPLRPTLNVERWMEDNAAKHRNPMLPALADQLGVTIPALELLDCRYAASPDTYAFPMRDGGNNLVGIRLRNGRGKKWAVTGSHSGLFIPQCEAGPEILLVEGPTDCAAALSLGYYAIGRPSCSGGIFHIQDYVRLNRIRRVIIMSDLDEPGMQGALTLTEHAKVWTAILLCPCKDLRAYLNNGGDKPSLDAIIHQLVWHKPQDHA